jgi:hypothetical protein
MTSSSTALATDPRPLSEVARHVITPLGIVSTSWPKVRDTCHRLGWRFDGWQDGSGRLILSKREDGSYAADTIVISIPRQVGKTYLIACIIFALCLIEPGLKVIWTAHRKSTSAETFRQFDGMAKRPKVAPHIRQVLRGKGDESIWFNNGSTIEFGARESGFGRGRTDVDLLVFDEGQILPESTLEDMGATQNVAKNPLTFVMGTPPRPKDDGEFFALLRQEALEGESDGTLYIEMSADRNADPMDREQWRKANASFPHRTTERAMLRLRKKLKSDDSWNREALGIWDEVTKQFSPINGALWSAGSDIGPSYTAKPDGLAVDMSHDRRISIGACWVEEDSAHVEEVWAGVDEAAAVTWVADAWKRAGRRTRVVIDAMSPASSMVPKLKALGVNVHAGTAHDMAKACGMVVSEVESSRFTHADQKSVNEAREGARKRAIGTAGGWGYDRTDSSVYLAPIVSVTLARFAASLAPRKRTSESSKTRKAVVL